MGAITKFRPVANAPGRDPAGAHFRQYFDVDGPAALAALNEANFSGLFVKLVGVNIISQGATSGGTQYQVQAVLSGTSPKVNFRFQDIAGAAVADDTDLSGVTFRIECIGV